MTEQAATPAPIPALGISISVNLSAQHAITLQTHIASDVAAAEINLMTDKMASVADRLIARYKLGDMRKNLELHQRMVERATRDLNDLDARNRALHETSKKKGDLQLTNAQMADRNNAVKSIERFKEEIEKIQIEIRAAEKEAT